MSFANVLLVSGPAHFSTRDVWDGYRIALDAAGVRVIPYPTFSFLKVLSGDAVCNDILGTALDISNRIDVVVFVDGFYFRGEKSRVPQSLKRAGIPTVLITTDDPYHTIPDQEDLYTYRFTNEIRCAGKGVTYLPTATLPLPEVPRLTRPPYDVSFLGTVFADRLPLLVRVAEFCEQERRRFLVAGKFPDGTKSFEGFACTEVRARTIDTLEKWEIYSQSKLTLNIFRETTVPAASPSPRVFEVTAFGQAALLTGPRRYEVSRIYADSVYHFDDAESAIAAIREALADDAGRAAKALLAKEITLREHLYEHRARTLIAQVREGERERAAVGTSEDRIAWIIGCGRTGSTWLSEMLSELPKIRRWHEPYFGRFLRHINEHPDDLDRRGSFFFKRHEAVWVAGLRDLFYRMVRERFPQFGRHGLVVKEVNTPELYPWFRTLFPEGRVILLLRDPFDVLDSYLDLQKPESWNKTFGDAADPQSPDNVRRTAEHIRDTLLLALETYDSCPVEQRLKLFYEDLLDDPVPQLIACGQLISVDMDEESAAAAVEKHAFKKHEQTGSGQFRRRGQAGGWKDSENFTAGVLAIAEEILGPLRGRLGYT